MSTPCGIMSPPSSCPSLEVDTLLLPDPERQRASVFRAYAGGQGMAGAVERVAGADDQPCEAAVYSWLGSQVDTFVQKQNLTEVRSP